MICKKINKYLLFFEMGELDRRSPVSVKSKSQEMSLCRGLLLGQRSQYLFEHLKQF